MQGHFSAILYNSAFDGKSFIFPSFLFTPAIWDKNNITCSPKKQHVNKPSFQCGMLELTSRVDWQLACSHLAKEGDGGWEFSPNWEQSTLARATQSLAKAIEVSCKWLAWCPRQETEQLASILNEVTMTFMFLDQGQAMECINCLLVNNTKADNTYQFWVNYLHGLLNWMSLAMTLIILD